MNAKQAIYTQCVNCFIPASTNHRNATSNIGSSNAVKDLPHEQIELLKEWVAAEPNYMEAKICRRCRQHLEESLASNNRQRKVGFKMVCKPCGKSIARGRRCDNVNMETPLGVILQSLAEYKIASKEDSFCHACFNRAQRMCRKVVESKIQKNCETDPTPNTNTGKENDVQNDEPMETENQKPSKSKTQKTLDLPITKILSIPTEQCLVQECQNYNITNLKTVAPDIRFELFTKHKIILHANCKVCHHHIREFPYDKIIEHPDLSNKITPEQIEDALLMVEQKNVVDFRNLVTTNDAVCRFWTGMGVKEFMEIHDAVNWDIEDSKKALALLLIRMRNKLSNSKMASLFNMSPSDIVTNVEDARRCLQKADCM